MCLLFKESVNALKLELINGRRLQNRGPFFNVRDTVGAVCAHRENEQLRAKHEWVLAFDAHFMAALNWLRDSHVVANAYAKKAKLGTG